MTLLALALWATVYFAFRDDPSPMGIGIGTVAFFGAALSTASLFI